MVVNESVAQRPCRQCVDIARHSTRRFPVFFQLLPIFGARATVFRPAGTWTSESALRMPRVQLPECWHKGFPCSVRKASRPKRARFSLRASTLFILRARDLLCLAQVDRQLCQAGLRFVARRDVGAQCPVLPMWIVLPARSAARGAHLARSGWGRMRRLQQHGGAYQVVGC